MAGQRSTALAAILAAAFILALAAPSFVGPSAARRAMDGPAEVSLRGASPLPPTEEQAAPASFSFKLGGAALSMLAALVVALMPVADAQAAKMGGRMGNAAPSQQKSRPAPPRPAAAPPPSSSTTVNKTVVNKTVIVQPAPVMGAPMMAGPSVGDMIVGNVVGNVVGSAISNTIMPRGPSGTDRMLENQQRQDERQMDKQQMELESLRREVQDMKISAAKS